MSQPLPDNIRSLMNDLAAGLRSILGNGLVGLYVGGSLALGDFCEATSDLDFLVVTEGTLSPEDLLAVGMLHQELLERHPAAIRLEGDYAPRGFLLPTGTTVPVPGCERGLFLPKVGEIMLSADNIYNMRQNAICITGPDPREVLPAVTSEQIRAAVRAMLQEGHGGCHTPGEAADGILSLCRSLYALEQGRPATKSEGAAWARVHLSPEWQPLIEAAVAIRSSGSTDGWGMELCDAVRDLDRHLRAQYM